MKFSTEARISLTYAKSTFVFRSEGHDSTSEHKNKPRGLLGEENLLLDGPREDPCVMGQSEIRSVDERIGGFGFKFGG
jgi:hypothetical protein